MYQQKTPTDKVLPGDACFTLNPRLRIESRQIKGTLWYLIEAHPQSIFRASVALYRILQQFDGKTPLQHILQGCHPAQAQRLQALLPQWLANGILLQGAIAPQPSRRRWHARSPIALRIALFNPDALLNRLAWLGRGLFSKGAALMLGFLLGLMLIQLPDQLDGLQQHWQRRFLDPANMVLMPLCFVLLKLLHELGHGLAVKRAAGRVDECGLYFLVFMPLPYVDTSASYFFSRAQRLLVGAAGMLVEGFIALLAFQGWRFAEPGPVADILFNLMLIGGISTLLFNLNPLMKFDGYYLLSDALGIVNLQQRAHQYLAGLVKRYALNMTWHSDHIAPWERKWLLLYGLLALPYRLLILLLICRYLAQHFFIFGVLLALLVLGQQLVFPLGKGMIQLVQQARQQQRLQRLGILLLCGASVLYLLFFQLKLTGAQRVHGVVVAAAGQQLVSENAGFITSLEQANLTPVQAGQTVARLRNPQLDYRLAVLAAHIAELQASRDQALTKDQVTIADFKDRIRALEQEQRQLQQQQDRLHLRAPSAGILVYRDPASQVGMYLTRGSVLAQIADPGRIELQVALSQLTMARLTDEPQAIDVKPAALPASRLAARIVGLVPLADRQLPSHLLGSAKGGDVQVDMRDQQASRALHNVFILTLQLQDWPQSAFLPATVEVRITFRARSLAQWSSEWIYSHWLAYRAKSA